MKGAEMDQRVAAVIRQSDDVRWLLDRRCEREALAADLSRAIEWMLADQAQRGRRPPSRRRENQRYAERLRTAGEKVVLGFLSKKEFGFGPHNQNRIQLEADVSLYNRISNRLAEAAKRGELRTEEDSPRAKAHIWRCLLLEYIHERTGEWPWQHVFAIIVECAVAVGLDLEKVRFSEDSLKQETYRFRQQKIADERARAAAEKEIGRLVKEFQRFMKQHKTPQTANKPEPTGNNPPKRCPRLATSLRQKNTSASH
jgi:hypothetical protein